MPLTAPHTSQAPNVYDQLLDQQIAADTAVCDALTPAQRAGNKTCILLDDPLGGWQVVQKMERQEAFLDALPLIGVGVLVVAVVWFVLWRRYGQAGINRAQLAGSAARTHLSSPVRLLQWILACVGVIVLLLAWQLLAR